MTTRKAKRGDRVRIGGPDGRIPTNAPPWMHRGTIRMVIEVFPCKHGGHCRIDLAGRGGSHGLQVRSDEVRSHTGG